MDPGDSTTDNPLASKAEDFATAEITKKFTETATIEWAVVGVEHGPPHPIVQVSPSQRFRHLRLHSRGGLGAVFVALDTEFNREVALKQILDPHADNPVNRSHYLLTGRAPLVGRDIMDVLYKLRIGEFPPPRQVNRLAPAALEAVALKAMALRPIDRYASARSLAEEIEHWLAAEPVSAWREPILGRARRWWRRHPRLSGAAGAATVVALVTLAGATLVLREYSRSEALAHSQAESHLVLAIESVAEFGSRFTDDPRIRARGLETFRRDLLLRARDFYRAIARELKGGNDPRLRAESGRIFLRIARITLELGSYAEAREAAELAVEAFARLKRERTGEESFAEGLAQSIECRGDVAIREFQFETARRSFQDAQAVWESLCLARPLVLSYRLGQASSLTRLGKVLNFQEDLPSAEAALRRGLKLCDGDEPSSREVRADLLEYLGQVQLARGLDRPRDSQEFSASLGAARETLEECLEIRSRLRAESPHDPKALSGFIKTFTTIATVCCNARQPGPVEGRLAEVRAIAEDLLREPPDVPDSKGMLAWCDAIHAICLAQLGQHERASDAAETAFSEAPTYGPAVYYATLGLCFAAEASGADRSHPVPRPSRPEDLRGGLRASRRLRQPDPQGHQDNPRRGLRCDHAASRLCRGLLVRRPGDRPGQGWPGRLSRPRNSWCAGGRPTRRSPWCSGKSA